MGDDLKPPDALSETSTEDLIDELLHRFNHAAFAGCRIAVKPEEAEFVRRFVGSSHMVMGLCVDLAGQALDHQIEAEESYRQDEDAADCEA